MKVRLISYTTPVADLSENMTDLKELVAFCARVSNPGNQMNTETSAKLVEYLKKNGHWSPFEMANICVEITTARDIARQILRHRSFSFQEFSQRYADPLDAGFEPVFRDARLQDTKNRQNSIELKLDDSGEALFLNWLARQESVWNEAVAAYKWALDHGIAKEVARAVLPEGITPSVLYMNGTIRSWIHYLDQRVGNGTQKEHQDVALEIAKAITKICPL
jgi:thymidylate synthase (FAD)